jgi:hypothetical protein
MPATSNSPINASRFQISLNIFYSPVINEIGNQ